MSRVFLDSNIFIYHFEDPGALGSRATHILKRLLSRGDSVFTSTLTLGEVLVKPVEWGDRFLENQYRSLLSGREIGVAPFDVRAGEIFALVRQDRGIKTADAIQLATAASAGCDLFITNNERLSNALVPGIQFIVSMDRAPL